MDIQDLALAKGRIAPYTHITPILSSQLLNQWLGHEIYFKAECLQKIGAFKARGACNTVAWLIENGQKPQQIIANSSGNHSQAVAWAAGQFGIPATIYMPQSASQIKIQATRAYGAEVVLCETRAEVDALVNAKSQENGTYWIPPYNHEQVIAGQGTAALEALAELSGINALFAPCGGGGLLSGTLIASRALAPQAKVFGVEPLNANDAAQSLISQSIQRLSSTPDTLADGAMTLSVGEITFEYLKQLDGMYEIGEKPIKYWTQWLHHLLKVNVEPTSAMSMEAVCQWLQKQTRPQKVLVILSGGNIDHQTRKKVWEKDYLSQLPLVQTQ
ncbi:serine/threonine dehydratase [Rapidithrix thailandica]|uniref:Serine/threonine dehydratase n=1 Tax=Rapidithrix thailandica TaxID=413964 RepID=A0AAW9SLE8_9BACT